MKRIPLQNLCFAPLLRALKGGEIINEKTILIFKISLTPQRSLEMELYVCRCCDFLAVIAYSAHKILRYDAYSTPWHTHPNPR